MITITPKIYVRLFTTPFAKFEEIRSRGHIKLTQQSSRVTDLLFRVASEKMKTGHIDGPGY